MKRILGIALSFVLFVLVLSAFSIQAEAAGTYYVLDGYNRIPIPETYIIKRIIYNTGEINGEKGYLKNAEDIFINAQGYLFVADTGNNRILKMTREGELLDIFKEADGIPFNSPKGIFVDDDGNMYVADSGNGRIVHMSATGEFVESFTKPVSKLISEDFFEYAPSKISISLTGYIYVLKDESIFMMDADNGFRGYLGQQKIGFDFIDYLLRKIASDKQKKYIVKRSAAPFFNMHVDKSGNIYAVTLDTKDGSRNKLIKKLNAVGENIYPEKAFGENIYYYMSMDGVPRFVDIVADENGIVSVIDEISCKVYQYDQEANLLTTFGGYGVRQGFFNMPSAIETDSEGNIYVLDKMMNTIQVFAPTAFIKLIHNALSIYHQGEYDKAKDIWEQVLKIDENYELAHMGIAKALYKQRSWKESMDEFKQADDKDGYSKAFQKYRHENFRKYFFLFVLGIFIVVYLVLRLIVAIKRNGENALEEIETRGFQGKRYFSFFKLALSVLFHPIQTFDIVKENRKSLKVSYSVIILLMAVAVRVFYIFTVHYPLAGIDPRDSNIWLEMLRILLPVLTWVAASFAVTSILEGESTIVEILTDSSLCMVPYIVINIPLALLSNVLCKNEETLFKVISYGSLIWVIILFLTSIKIINDYGIMKTVLTTAMCLSGMLLIWAVSLILIVFSTQLYEFVIGLMREIRMMQL